MTTQTIPHKSIPPGIRFRREDRNILEAWEPLPTKAGPDAQPYCCYLGTVIFYHSLPRTKVEFSGRAHSIDWEREMDRVETRMHLTWGDNFVWARGAWWLLSSGTVRWKHGRWWMVHTLIRNDKNAIERNGDGWILQYPGPFDHWYWRLWYRSTMPIRDLLRHLRVLPGRPPKGWEYPMGWEEAI